MSSQAAPRARRRATVIPEPLIGDGGYDYADSFEIQLRMADSRTPEQLFRGALNQGSSVLRWAVPIVHRYVLLFQLDPNSSPEHILGWHIVTSQADVIHLETVGPLMRGAIVGRRVGPTGVAAFQTFVFYRRRSSARIVWAVAAPLHRWIAPYLLQQGAATANDD